MNKIRFDFGEGAPYGDMCKITGDMLYDENRGYGIDQPTEAVTRSVGEQENLRDFLLFSGHTFRAKLDNGTYQVRLYTGDYVDEGDVTTSYCINGVENAVWVYDGCVIVCEHLIEVTDGFLTLTMAEGRHSCLNALEIAPIFTSTIGGIHTDITATADKQAVTFSWEPTDGADGYQIERTNLQNKEKDKILIVKGLSYTDEDVALCEKYIYRIGPVNDYAFVSSYSEPIEITVTDGQPVTDTIEELSVNETETSITLTWKAAPHAVYYNVYQKAPHGIYKKVAQTKKTSFIHDKITTCISFIYAVEAVTTSGKTTRAEISTEIIAKPFRRKMESLSRAPVAIKTAEGVFLSWRLNAYEYKAGLDFMLFRNGERLTKNPITDSTNYLDKDGNAGDTYTIKAVKGHKMEREGCTVVAVDIPYFSLPLDKPAPYTTPDGKTYEYSANDAAVGDLDGDGEYEIVLKWVANGKDNSHKGYTGVCYLDAYKLDGTKMWRIDMGVNIREGAHYTQFIVYDLNNDGKAEMICKTADGTIDGVGNVIGDKDADYRNQDGFILNGPEFLTVFDGQTGAAIDTVDYDPPRGNVRDWGDSWGNRVDRFLACVAYLDGVHPSVVMCRGYYDHGCPTVLVAYDLIHDKLIKRWRFVADKDHNIEYTNQGNHNLAVGDVDGDGLDEIVYGAMAVDHDGQGIYSTGLEHGDALHLGKFTTKTETLDFFQIHEHEHAEYGYEVRDPATGEIKWGKYTGCDTTRGLCAKIDPRYEGNQVWALDEPLYTIDGEVITENAPSSINFAIWWDGDLIRELLDHDWDGNGHGVGRIYKWDYENEKLDVILDTKDAFSNNWTKGNPCIQADILGDWREEAVWRNEDSTELRIYTTTHLTNHKFYTLMHDNVYRLGVALQNVGYNQPPHTGFYIGDEMDDIPVPDHDYINGAFLPDFVEDIDD